jgi:copper chaperone
MKCTMTLKLNVPTINSPEDANALKETLLTSEPDARVDVDLNSKTVTVESQASEETFKQLIIAAGHKLVV